MTQPIFLANAAKDRLRALESTTFSSIGIRERDDLQRWVLSLPDLLQEPLLVLSSEFDRFDRSDRRLDVLALDKGGRLVVVELKRELAGTFADQQALRYAAFCSTMTMDEAVEALASYQQITAEEAGGRVLEFLDADELPDLADQPRIILAGSSLDDQELVSTVHWLRTFGIDITCVELVPYQLPEGGPIAIVPRTIIPLPEAKDYLVRVQMKARKLALRREENNEFLRLWEAIMSAFNAQEPRQFTLAAPGKDRIMQIRTGIGTIHYEWTQARMENLLRIATHFEDKDLNVNLHNLGLLEPLAAGLEQSAGEPFFRESWGVKWARAEFRIPLDAPDVAERGAHLMNLLINQTWPTLQRDHIRTTG